MDREAVVLYDLNRKTIEIKNSKEYFIGVRIDRYLHLIKSFHIISFLIQLLDDVYRVLCKRKRNPNVERLDFSKQYTGERIAVYTAIFGDYDIIKEPLYRDPNCDYYIITDQKLPSNSVWKVIDVSFPEGVDSAFLKNRYVKFMAHKIFSNYRFSLYMDGNLQLVSAVSLYFSTFYSKCGIGLHRHPSNVSLYEEVSYNVKLHKICKSEADLLLKRYKKEGMPRKYGMFECNVIMRDHASTEGIMIMEKWWEEVSQGVHRDQLYFTLILFELGYLFEDVYLMGNNINANPMFIREEHI